MRRPNSPILVVGPNDSMPDVLNRLRQATGGAAALAIPASSSLFLTASEFRALKSAAEEARITLTVETDDRLRKQLASMFHLPVVDLLPGALSDLEESPPADAPTDAPKRERLLPELPRLDLPPPLEVAPRWVPPSGDDEIDEPGDDPHPVPPRRGRNLPVKSIGFGLAIFVALLAVSAILAYLLQTATVSITVKRQPVSAELTYAVVSPGQDAPDGGEFSLTAEPVTFRVPFEETIPVTGELREPDGVASGTVALRNLAELPVEIAAGTPFNDRDGTEYRFTANVTVPAASTDGSAGRADATVNAAAGGESGNREVGLLTGQLENGIYYSNRNGAISGGTDRITKVVAQADIDGLIAAATAGIPRLAISNGLPDGRFVLPGSLQTGELTHTLDHVAGDVADTLTIRAEMDMSGMAFSVADAVAQANGPLGERLQANTPAGFELQLETLAVADPVLVNDAGIAGLYALTATAAARTIVDEAEQATIVAAIAGMSVTDARLYVSSLSYVEGVTITSSPGFLPERIPGDAGKIEIEIQ